MIQNHWILKPMRNGHRSAVYPLEYEFQNSLQFRVTIISTVDIVCHIQLCKLCSDIIVKTLTFL